MSLQIRTSQPSSSHRHRLAFIDVKESLKLWRLACSLAWYDLQLRYKGSLLGPLWMTCTTGVTIIMIGLIYGSLFGTDLHLYIPHLSITLILWSNAISLTLIDGCQCFLQEHASIHSIRLPFFLQALRTVIRNIIVTGFNLIIPVIVFSYYHIWPRLILYSLPGFMLWIMDGLAVCILLGCVCARFRDIPQIINSFIQILYYVTPIMWLPSQIHHFQSLLLLNPIYVIMEIATGPILGRMPSLTLWEIALGYSLILWVLAWFTFARSRNRLAFWI